VQELLYGSKGKSDRTGQRMVKGKGILRDIGQFKAKEISSTLSDSISI